MLPGQRFIEDRIIGALRAWMIVGILLRVTRLRDRFDGLSLVYYSTPWPVLAAGFLLLAAHHYRRANWHPMRRYAAFTVVALFTWIATSWYSAEPIMGETAVRPASPAIRLVQWNVARPLDRLEGCAEWLRAQDADIICLSEAEPLNARTRDLWQLEFPGYRILEGPAYLLCLVRGETIRTGWLDLGSSSFGSVHQLRIRGREVTVFQVDIIAQAYRSRREPLRRLTEVAEAHPTGDLLIVGDFNTPRESAHLDALRGKFRHAFETAGSGLAETWPTYAPALSLDHVWLGSAWQALRCRHGWNWRSDHRPVIVDLAARPRE